MVTPNRTITLVRENERPCPYCGITPSGAVRDTRDQLAVKLFWAVQERDNAYEEVRRLRRTLLAHKPRSGQLRGLDD